MTPRQARGLILGLLALLAGSMAGAQESDSQDSSETDSGRGNFFVEISSWIAQPSGLEYRAATVGDPLDPFGGQVLSVDQSDDPSAYYRAGFEFPGETGDIILSYFAQEQMSDLEILTPGLFLYGEINTSGFLSGVNNDALSDGFSADTRTRLRDVRVDYYRRAFKSKKVSGKWFVGYRRVTHDRKLDTQYFASAPNLPPIIPPVSPPRPDLVPTADSARLSSDWEGRGLEAGLDVRIPMFRNKVSFESGLAVAVLRGKVSTNYTSETHFYAVMDGDLVEQVLQPPYGEFEDATVNSVRQIAGQVGVQSTSESADGNIIETYIAVRWRFWKTAEFVAGFRNISYDGVGMDVRTDQVTPETGMEADELNTAGTRVLRLNPSTLARTDYSVDYEGFYFGLAVRF